VSEVVAARLPLLVRSRGLTGTVSSFALKNRWEQKGRGRWMQGLVQILQEPVTTAGRREREREGDGKLPEIWRARRKMQKKKKEKKEEEARCRGEREID